MGRAPLSAAALRALRDRLGDRVSVRPADLDAASRDASSLPGSPPDAVVWPLATDEVQAVVRLAADARVPVTARGAGSSLEGNPIPVRGGIVLDLSRMSRVLAVRARISRPTWSRASCTPRSTARSRRTASSSRRPPAAAPTSPPSGHGRQQRERHLLRPLRRDARPRARRDRGHRRGRGAAPREPLPKSASGYHLLGPPRRLRGDARDRHRADARAGGPACGAAPGGVPLPRRAGGGARHRRRHPLRGRRRRDRVPGRAHDGSHRAPRARRARRRPDAARRGARRRGDRRRGLARGHRT
jgi:hypothetical protein